MGGGTGLAECEGWGEARRVGALARLRFLLDPFQAAHRLGPFSRDLVQAIIGVHENGATVRRFPYSTAAYLRAKRRPTAH